MRTVSQRRAELDQLTLKPLSDILIKYSPAATERRITKIKSMNVPTLIEKILNYELGAALIDWDQWDQWDQLPLSDRTTIDTLVNTSMTLWYTAHPRPPMPNYALDSGHDQTRKERYTAWCEAENKARIFAVEQAFNTLQRP